MEIPVPAYDREQAGRQRLIFRDGGSGTTLTIAYITAGAAGTICGNCIKDNALAAALKARGQDVVLLPAYTPLLTDEVDVSDSRIVFGGINLYLQGKFALFRSTGILDRFLDHPKLLRWASKIAVDTDPANLGPMTRDMFLGAIGPYRREMAKLLELLREIRPAVVHLTNSMLASMAEPVKRHLGAPVICSLQGEAEFLQGLPEPFRSECYELLGQHAEHIDRFVAPCRDQAESMARILGRSADRIDTILPGIAVEDFRKRNRSEDGRFVVGFLARVSPEKGLDILADAVERLRSSHPDQRVELRVAGWRAESMAGYLDALRERCDFEDLGYLSRSDKIEFLASLDAFSVPTTYRASKGLYVLEALASGVPVVQPGIGAFPELLEATDGGYLCNPGDSRDLASKLELLMSDRGASAQRGAGARRRVHADFHAARMATDTLNLYKTVAGHARPPSHGTARPPEPSRQH